MKPQTLLAIAITTLGLAACGSGGGSAGNIQLTPTPTPGGNTPPAIQTNERAGTAIIINPTSYRKIGESALRFTDRNFNTLTVEGKEIAVIPPGIQAGEITTIRDENSERVARNTLSYSSFGYVHDSNTTNGYMFSQGIRTLDREMPTSGTFSYEGHAAHADQTNPAGRVVSGPANFRVDFGAKTISGTINPAGKAPVVLDNGSINGNHFSGNASSGAAFDGHFYGGSAEELGGIYQKLGDYTGAFGAIKIVE
ncbi:transferrin-binding protein-like solute binding protein [Eikenella sp. S3360]|uniref:Transferrin-binding protein-like solute binding protein n=1 Tax=Eikenella glucosivorans TaxID=2766967 RepID=A0ABS0N9V0_9NEIS|nr:Slam-dependent surface lipoprotein [Eikenella glucosivorans]MBH5329093.1 transferrin-binding protein-like solute binding protein [Eikenella glucosivorans]